MRNFGRELVWELQKWHAISICCDYSPVPRKKILGKKLSIPKSGQKIFAKCINKGLMF